MFHYPKYTLRKIFTIIFLTVSVGCASYYQKNIVFHRYFADGEMEEAAKVLESNEPGKKDKSRLLYLLQKGVVLQMLEDYEQSNLFFEEAYLFTEDVQKNYSDEALSLLTNPMVVTYKGEDFERIHIHYYKAMNYLMMRKFEEALVECRRINIALNELEVRYGTGKIRYKRDAFALNLMGIIFEASGEINNAFISYRNAYEAYVQDYERYYGVGPPMQLKKDLLRSAWLNGFRDELEFYEKEFGLKYSHEVSDGGELIYFWKNGLGPVKDEWSINFVIVKGKAGMVTFVNEGMGLSFPFKFGRKSKNRGSSLGDLKVVRVAFPKYRVRVPVCSSAVIIAGDTTYKLELAQNINEIALKNLEDRMVRELGKTLLRFAVKQAAEELTRKKNEVLGTIVSLLAAATEKADTRNWQTLPYSISYARVPLEKGENTLELKSYSSRNQTESTVEFNMTSGKGKTLFSMYHNLETMGF